ncbi:hypothetical protein NJB1907E11_19040, partial [Mycobacterium marinum]
PRLHRPRQLDQPRLSHRHHRFRTATHRLHRLGHYRAPRWRRLRSADVQTAPGSGHSPTPANPARHWPPRPADTNRRRCSGIARIGHGRPPTLH